MTIFHLDFNHVSMRYDVIHDLLPKIAAMGYTAILWELEAQVAWETCPECATPETWSKDQFRELLAYSRTCGLEPIPLLQTIGHGEYVMSHATYHPFREHADFSDCYCVSNPDVRTFLKRWVAEYLELFGDLRYFHLGGDEAYRFGSCPDCAARDRLELYGEHIHALAEDLFAAGIRPGVWGDMILAKPDEVGAISKDFLIWDWNYSDGIEAPKSIWLPSSNKRMTPAEVTPELAQQFPGLLGATGSLNTFHGARFFKNHGYDIVLCSAARSAIDSHFSPNTVTHAANIAGAELLSREKQLVGHCVTSWSIRMNPIRAGFPLMALPKAIQAAPEAGLDAWRKDVSRHVFGFEDGMDAADLISRCDSRLRSYSALQWTGLKDGVPTPKGHLAKRIKQWIAEDEPWWSGRAAMLADMRQTVQKGLALMEPYAPGASAASLWTHIGRLQLEYIDLLEAIFVQNADLASVAQRLKTFKTNTATFFSSEQAPLSAKANAGLIVDPLCDYLAGN